MPGLQKQITRAARKAGKPVVVATQMLESMIKSPSADPRRSLRRGHRGVRRRRRGDAVGGIRSRRYPVEAVETMDRIAAAGGGRRALSVAHRSPARAAGKDHARRHHGGGA